MKIATNRLGRLGLTYDGGGDSLLTSDTPAEPIMQGGRYVPTRDPIEHDPISESGWHADQRLSQPSCGCWPLPWRRGHYGSVWVDRSHSRCGAALCRTGVYRRGA